jgi:hypothetical protein
LRKNNWTRKELLRVTELSISVSWLAGGARARLIDIFACGEISTPYRYHIIAGFEVKLRPSSAYGAFGPYIVNITCCAVWLGLSVDAAIEK